MAERRQGSKERSGKAVRPHQGWRRLRMKRVLIVTLIGIAVGGAATQSKTVRDFYQDIYPSDPGKRHALDLCILSDLSFNRLDPTARDKCYQHALVESMLAAETVHMDRAPNQVDLRQAAGRGNAER
jgi:hypothetical protein